MADTTNGSNNPKITPESVLTTSEVAALLHVSPVTVEMWVRNKVLRSSKTADGHDHYRYSDILKHAERLNITVDGDITKITKVLIVDDDSFIADFIKDFLESREIVYEVQRTGVSFMADKLMRKFHPHVLILDLRMPGMSGIDLCRQFGEQIVEGLRVIGVSGFWTEEDKKAFLSVGGEYCLDKPLDVKELVEVLEENRQFGDGYDLRLEF